VATAIDLVVGVAVGFALARLRFPGRELVDSILLLPMVAAADRARLLPARRRRPARLDRRLARRHARHPPRLHVAGRGARRRDRRLPRSSASRRRSHSKASTSQLEQAARVLGLGRSAVFFRVTLPLAWRGILAGCCSPSRAPSANSARR
jgi:molybdate transport system permease protein